MNRSTRRAFTIVELLVIITIIVLLLALLTPALDQALKSAELAVCSSNQHNVGLAIALYLGDHKRRYPVMDVWWDLFGELGANTYPALDNVTQKPLNVYLGYTSDKSRVPVAQCPSDLGDSHASNARLYNLYKTLGVSYGASYAHVNVEPSGIMATKMIFGHDAAAGLKYGGTYAALSSTTHLPSARETSLSRLDNKVLLADFVWYNGRPTDHIRTRWHRPESDERYLNTLLADMHVDLLNWDKERIDPRYGGNERRQYEASWKWW